ELQERQKIRGQDRTCPRPHRRRNAEKALPRPKTGKNRGAIVMSEEQKNRQDEQEQPAAAAPPAAEQNGQPAEQNEQAADEPSPIRCTAVLDGKMQARIGRENRSTGILFAVLGAAALAFGILF